MMILTVLAAMVVCVAGRSSDSSSDSHVQFEDAGHVSTSDFVGKDFNTRVQLALLRKQQQADAVNQGLVITSSTSSSDGSGSSSSTESALERQHERDVRRDQQLKAAIIAASAKKAAAAKRVSYQAVFRRNNTAVCTNGPILIVGAPQGGTVMPTPGGGVLAPFAFDQLNGTTIVASTACANRTLGPVVLISKLNVASILADSYDGNGDGKDDVQAAFDTFALGHHTGASGNNDNLVPAFLLAVRNRATVNGGSIKLQALVVTGRQQVSKKSNVFATFGGPDSRLLISPCFPVIQDPQFAVELVGAVSGLGGLFDAVPGVTYQTFVNNQNTPLLTDDVFLDQTASINLLMSSFPNPNTAVGGTVQKGVNVGTVSFQKCTQHSYFQ